MRTRSEATFDYRKQTE